MSDQLTTEQMLEALEAAGKRIKTNATDDEVAMAHLELEAELEAAGIIPPTAPDEPEVIAEVPSLPTAETINDVITRVRLKVMGENKRDYLGDKEPEVIEWARKHLTPEEFEACYAGRLR